MKIGCPKEIKNHEYRVGLVPSSVRAYVSAGHTVTIERDAGLGIGITNEQYVAAGARVCASAADVWETAEMIVKVKEPLPLEYQYLRKDLLVYTYFHFAANLELTDACLRSGIAAVAYETIRDNDGNLPVLKPMSEVAGRMAPIMGAYYLAKPHGGPGILPSGVPGVLPANVLILGGGTVGSHAALIAAGLGARVTILDVRAETLEHLGQIMPKNVFTLWSNQENLENALSESDLVIGAVLLPGAKAPKLIRRSMLALMKPSSVFVDVAIDQGGCAETSHATTHSDPVYVVDGILHYCVANMPGAYARTSTIALNNAALPYGLQLASRGPERACTENPALREGLNIYRNHITFRAVADSFGLSEAYSQPEALFGTRRV